MDLKEAYLAMHKASGIKVGDTVRVIRTCKSGEMGWDSDWTGPKNKYVGQQFEVKRDLQECGFSDPEEYYFPFFVLEKIKDAKQPVKVKLNDSYTEEYKGGETVHVGCQDIPKIAVFELADKIREYDK